MPQIPQFVNENEEFGVDIDYYKVEEEFQNFLKGFGIAD